jgi:hypothetical protein
MKGTIKKWKKSETRITPEQARQARPILEKFPELVAVNAILDEDTPVAVLCTEEVKGSDWILYPQFIILTEHHPLYDRIGPVLKSHLECFGIKQYVDAEKRLKNKKRKEAARASKTEPL